MKIVELRPGMKRVDLKGTIVEISESREVTTRFGDVSRVATAVLADDSGRIKMSLWNENIDKVSVNNIVQIENGYVTTFQGESQLNVGRYGKITVLQ